ncbi:MAG: hypothetical protein HY671_00705 [Chloroflexi bacterium]|nr:hypothetical protein [Chloroflexota bacterium]
MKGTVSSLFRPSWVKVVVGVLVVGVVVGVPVAVLGQRSPTPPAGLPTVIPGKPPPAVDRRVLEKGAEALRTSGSPEVDAGDGHVLRVFEGPRTRGMTIEVAGVSVILPMDAELGGVVSSEDYVPPGVTPFPLPAYQIIRGGENAWLSVRTGQYKIDGCLEPFQFLIDRLGPEKLWGTAKQCR